MFTTGSKLLIGSAAAAAVFAAVYGILQGGALGTIGLTFAAAALAVLAGLNLFVRDSNVSALDHAAFDSSAAAQATARPSLWPLLVALGATTLTLGLVTTRAFFVIGLVAVIAGAIEWLLLGWSERASSDASYNAGVRDVMADPVELPVAGAIGAAVIVYSFSRVMLGLPSKSATVVAFAVLAGLVLLVGTLVGVRRGMSKTRMTGAFSVAALALIGAGTFAGLNGERETHLHHTTADIAEENECGPEKTDADENASQTVAAKSNPAAEIVFDGAGLTGIVDGFDGNVDVVTLTRASPNNVLFRNESASEARLVIEMHPALDDEGEPLGPERICTALVEDGGMQLLTLVFDRPSYALESGYSLTVPGTDAALEVVVP
jgi:hypothetical protein